MRPLKVIKNANSFCIVRHEPCVYNYVRKAETRMSTWLTLYATY